MPAPPVSVLKGGCLCGKVRYQVDLKKEDSWPPDPHTCSCTDCRKRSGSILLHYVTLNRPQITWEGTVSEYQSSAKRFWGFCSTCGANLFWREVQEDLDEIEICVGTFDKDVLRNDGLAKDLTNPIGGKM